MKITTTALLVISLLLIFSGVLCAATDNKARLEKGEIVTEILKSPVTGVSVPTGQCLVDASLEDVWWIITDFNSFGEFLPHVIYYKPVSWDKDKLLVDCKITVALMKISYRLSYSIDEANHMTSWSYVSGPIRDAKGYWKVEPYDAKRVLVTYTTTFDAGKMMPAFLEKMLSKSTFPDIFSSLRKRILYLKSKDGIKKPALLPRPS